MNYKVNMYYLFLILYAICAQRASIAFADSEIYPKDLKSAIKDMTVKFGDMAECKALQTDIKQTETFRFVNPLVASESFDQNIYNKYTKSCPNLDISVSPYFDIKQFGDNPSLFPDQSLIQKALQRAHRDFRLYRVIIDNIGNPVIILFARDYMNEEDWKRFESGGRLMTIPLNKPTFDDYSIIDLKACSMSPTSAGIPAPGRLGIVNDNTSIYRKGGVNYIVDYNTTENNEKTIRISELRKVPLAVALAFPLCGYSK